MNDPMKKICQECQRDGKWYPTSISNLETYLGKFIKAGAGVPNVVGLRKNIAYNIQYLQSQLLDEFDVTQVILTDTDWWTINKNEVDIIKGVLYSFFTSSLFKPTVAERQFFQFLR